MMEIMHLEMVVIIAEQLKSAGFDQEARLQQQTAAQKFEEMELSSTL
jgi:hypothetical protein